MENGMTNSAITPHVFDWTVTNPRFGEPPVSASGRAGGLYWTAMRAQGRRGPRCAIAVERKVADGFRRATVETDPAYSNLAEAVSEARRQVGLP